MIACLTVRHEYKPILSCLFFVACATATIISTSILIQNKMNSKTKELLDKLLVGNRGALARAITLVESQNPHHMKQANLLLERASQHLKSDRAFCVGIAVRRKKKRAPLSSLFLLFYFTDQYKIQSSCQIFIILSIAFDFIPFVP